MAGGLEELRIKIGVLKAQIKSILDTNPYDPIASTATEPELQKLVDNLNAAIEDLEA